MSTLNEQYLFQLNLAMGQLKGVVAKYVEEDLELKEIFLKLGRKIMEERDDLFFMCSWDVDDNMMLQLAIAVMYQHYMKADEKIAAALKAELEVLRMLGAGMQSGGMLNVDEMVRLTGGHEMLGMNGLWWDVKKKFDWDTKRRPLIERAERELEGKA